MDVPEDVDCELIVVDNASTDHTREVIERANLTNLSVKYVFEPKQGQCQARNTGVAQSKGNILLWTDDDVRVPYDWVEAMCRPLIEGTFDAVAGGVKMAPHLERSWMTIDHKGGLADTERIDPVDLKEMVGANMAFSRRILSKVPLFDTELGPGALGFGDDTLFAFQIVEAGFKLGSRLDIYIEHHFDPDRLQRDSYLTSSKKMGSSWAYIDYHWHHRELQPWPYLLKRPFRLFFWRFTRKKEMNTVEGIPWWEYRLLFDIHYLKAFIKESKHARKYEKRGLVKIQSPNQEVKARIK
jgi:glycosyltransferase involved in cell wall biosynthesis